MATKKVDGRAESLDLREDPKTENSKLSDLSSQISPLVVIVGQTASGKSALAMRLAQRFNGEIICADSRTVYTSMDIGTAKPSAADRAAVPHHLLDVITPDQKFTVADFKQQAAEAIDNIASRDKLPIMVGGTGLYIDSVLFDYQFSSAKAERDEHNPRHLKKAEQPNSPQPIRSHTLVLGLQPNREELEQRVKDRVDIMVAEGFVDEVQHLVNKYGWEVPALLTPGYRAFRDYLGGTTDLVAAKEAFVRNDMQLARRQRSWFKRNKSIQWLEGSSDPISLVEKWLQTGYSE